MQRKYWRFYWPLALMGVAMLVSRQVQNRTLASYPDAKRELALFALAFSAFGFFRAALAFVPQMTNVLVRSEESYRLCRSFTVTVCLLLTLPVSALALTSPGEAVLRGVFRVDDAALAPVVLYMRFFLPLVLVTGLAQFYTGVLVQARRTGTVTALQVTRLALVVAVLAAGWRAGADTVLTLALSQLVPSLVHLALSYVLHLVLYSPPDEREPLAWRDMLRFFWPVALTSTMFALSRPIIYSFLMRLPDGEAEVASLAVTFGFAMLFHTPINQFRHLFATFGRDDPAGVRRFMLKVMAAAFALMVLAAATPLARLSLRWLLNVKGDVLEMATSAFRPLCLIPLVLTFRNYYHGISLVGRRTRGMAAGGVARNAAVYLAALALLGLGRLDHVTGASALVLGFAAEGLTVFAFVRLARRREARTESAAA